MGTRKMGPAETFPMGGIALVVCLLMGVALLVGGGAALQKYGIAGLGVLLVGVAIAGGAVAVCFVLLKRLLLANAYLVGRIRGLLRRDERP